MNGKRTTADTASKAVASKTVIRFEDGFNNSLVVKDKGLGYICFSIRDGDENAGITEALSLSPEQVEYLKAFLALASRRGEEAKK